MGDEAIEYVLAVEDPDAVVEKLLLPATRIVSLTITEGGYDFDQVTGEFDLSNPDERHDLADGVQQVFE